MRILILNWRDPNNPKAGGAEVVNLALARRWVAAGHEVTWFSGAFRGAASEDNIDGVRILRRGRPWNVHWWALWAYLRGTLRGYDLVVDQIHGFGFLTPLYVRAPKLALIYEVAGKIWFKMYPLPVALAGYLLERPLLRLYRNTPFFTLADSTREDLVRVGISDDRITVFAPGLTFEPPSELPAKDSTPAAISVGRICEMKQTEVVIEAFALFRQRRAEAQLWIVGQGDDGYVQKCRRRVTELGLEDAVTFFGFVSEQEKLDLMGRARVLVSASIKEGWGLIVDEANAMGTPVAVYDVPGFRNSVARGWGITSSRLDPAGLAEAMLDAAELPPPRAQPSIPSTAFERAALEMLSVTGPGPGDDNADDPVSRGKRDEAAGDG